MTNPQDFSDRPYEGWYFHFIEHWSQFFVPCNWRNFTFFELTFEDDTVMGGIEMTFVVLGIGTRIRYNHTRTELVDEIATMMDDISSGKATLKDIFPTAGKDDDRKDSPSDKQ